MICYKKASLEELEALWDREIAENPDDDRYLRWKDSFLQRNRSCRAATFLILADGEPIGQVTLDRYADGYSGNRAPLADGVTTAYVNSLRIAQEYQGQGYVSGLMHFMENWARNQGFAFLTIGAEADNSRNLAIYRHWGYNKFRMMETDDGIPVLFYAKEL